MNRLCKSIIGCVFVYAVHIAALLFAVAWSSYAAEALTLEQAVETALRNNPGLKAADAQVEAAQAAVSKARSGYLPRVSVSETYSRSDNPLMVLGAKLNQEIVSPADFDPAVMNNPEPLSNYTTKFSVMQPVFNGGKVFLGVKQAKLGADAAAQDRVRAQQETAYNVIKAYYGLLLARESHKVALQSLETSEANVKLAEARYRAGAVLQSDLLRARVQLAEVKEMATRAGNSVKLAEAALNFAMGVPQSSEYEVTGDLTGQQAAPDMDTLIRDAGARRPDLASMGLNRKNAEMNVSQARTGYLPSLNVMGEADWNSRDLAGDDARSWAVMAVFQWNLFDGLVTKARVREALASSDRMRALEEQTRSAVELEVRQAYYNLAASLDRIAVTSSSVQEAEEGLRIVQKRYEVGMTTFVDVLGAENALIRARNSSLQALFDNNVAGAELKLATGTL
jgi:TolC family type I secretion outer membrane protein